MLSYSVWHSLPLTLRNALAQQFGIAKVGPTHVFNNTVESDGYKFQDIERTLTTEALQAYTESDEEDYPALFKMTIDKLEGREAVSAPMAAVIETTELRGEGVFVNGEPVTTKIEEVKSEPKKRGRPAKIK